MGVTEYTLLIAAAGLYLLVSVAMGAAAVSGRDELKRTLAHGIWLGVAAHTALLATRWAVQGHFPAGSVCDRMLLLAWLLAVAYAGMQTALRNVSLGMFVGPLVVLLLAFAFFTTDRAGSLAQDADKARWLYAHITIGFASFACFTLATVAGVGYLFQEHFLKSRQKMKMNLPPLEWLDNAAYRLVSIGLPLLTLGIITGAVCFKTLHGMFWTWTPKQMVLVVLWSVYAVYLHIRAVRGWRGRGTNLVLVCGFIILFAGFFIVRQFH